MDSRQREYLPAASLEKLPLIDVQGQDVEDKNYRMGP